MSNISKQFNKISKKRELSGKSNPEDDRKKLEKEVSQPAIKMALNIKYSDTSAQQMIFQKC